jgi:hypothetical protein
MKRSAEPDLRYSNSLWVLPSKKIYMAVGYHCELIVVFPELDIVAVTTARDFCRSASWLTMFLVRSNRSGSDCGPRRRKSAHNSDPQCLSRQAG